MKTNYITGERIRAAREQIGYSQEQMAEQLNCSAITISRLENGTRPIKGDILKQLIELTGVSADWILDCRSQGTYIAKLEELTYGLEKKQIKIILAIVEAAAKSMRE